MINQHSAGAIKAELALSVKRNSQYKSTDLADKLRRVRNLLLRGDADDYGTVCRKLLTSAGVALFANHLVGNYTVDPGGPVFMHGWGTGATPPAIADEALQTPAAPTTVGWTTGTKVAASTPTGNATVYSQATITSGGALNITEHGVMMMIDNNTEALIDRSVFTAVPLQATDEITFKYTLTLYAGNGPA